MYRGLLYHYWICWTKDVNQWGWGSHRSTRYNSQTHAVVSPAAAQLIQTLTTISNPPCLGSSCSPGITQRHWALTSSAVGREPAAGAEAWGTHEG